MKRAISGKIYNTDTAEEICEGGNGMCPNDFNSFYECLYKTKKGAYFIAGNGGPMSKYGQDYSGGGTVGGESMKLVTESEALKFCEVEELAPEKIAEHFEIEEG